MKRNQSFLMFGVSVLFLALVGCSKDDNEMPTGEQAIEQLRTAIIGKWTIRNFPADLVVASSKSSLQLHTKVATTESPRRPTRQLFGTGTSLYAETGGDGSSSGFIEFLPDDTYLVQDAEGNVLSDGYVVKSGQSIDLSNLGSITEIKFSGDRIDFKVSLSIDGTNKVLQISANKAPEVEESDRTNLLTRTWEMMSVENQDGLVSYGDEGVLFDYEVPVDQLRVTFSKSGTYALRYFYEGEVVAAETANWRWSPSGEPDKLEYAWDDDPFSDEHAVTITTLTATTLVVYEEDTGDDLYTISTLNAID